MAVRDDTEWEALCRAMGRPELAGDERFAGAHARWEHRADLEELLSGWTRDRTARETADLLQAARVPAEPVATTADLLFDPHLKERGFFQLLDHGDEGEHPIGRDGRE